MVEGEKGLGRGESSVEIQPPVERVVEASVTPPVSPESEELSYERTVPGPSPTVGVPVTKPEVSQQLTEQPTLDSVPSADIDPISLGVQLDAIFERSIGDE